jgi:AraC-like DNA-binding protein
MLRVICPRIICRFQAICFVFLFLSNIHSQPQTAISPCLQIDKPKQGVAIDSIECMLSILPCQDIQSVLFKVQYLGDDGVTENLVTIGNMTRPPYSSLWNLTSIPNQVYSGATFIVEARMKNGLESEIRREGIFLTHQPIKRSAIAMPYATTVAITGTSAINLSSPETPSTGTAILSWNEKDLNVHVAVKDNFFYAGIEKKKFATLGVELLLDPLCSRDPYPSKKTIMFVVPLMGNPYRLFSKPQYLDDGTFTINEYTREYALQLKILKEDFKGYTINFSVPWKDIFLKGMPEQLGCNIIAKALDRNGEIRKISWTGTKKNSELYTPIYWGTITCAPRPLLANNVILWVVCFISGIGLGMAGGWFVLLRRRKSNSMGRFERSEEEKKVYETIRGLLEADITDRELSIGKIANQIALPPKKIEALIRAYNGESFRSHLMRSRIEIAKERLRSSHCSETAVATSSGFVSVDEMEKYFKKFYRITPYKFREENQIT